MNSLRALLSPPSIIILSVTVAIITSIFFSNAVITVLSLSSSSQSRGIADLLFALPLIISWIILLPLLCLKIYKGNILFRNILFFVILFVVFANFFDLIQKNELFKLPFMGYQLSPLTQFEKNKYEQEMNLTLLLPTYLPDGYKPFFHTFSKNECPQLELAYTTGGPSISMELYIQPIQCAKQIEGQLKDNDLYEVIPLPQLEGNLYFQEEFDSEAALRIKRHYFITKEARYLITQDNYISKNDLIKIIESLK